MKHIRIFIRYENGTYEIKKVPFSKNIGIQGISFMNVLENVFEDKGGDEAMPQLLFVKNTKRNLSGGKSSELSFYKANDKKDVEESKLLFFRKVVSHNNPLSQILPVCEDLLNSDVEYLKNNWTYPRRQNGK